jgi:hypothetical protein
MKRVIIVALMLAGLASCRIIKPGCPDTWGKVGYASNNIPKPLNHSK